MKKQFIVTEQNINQRLDMYIASLDLDLSRSMAQKIIENGQVLVNKKILTSKNINNCIP